MSGPNLTNSLLGILLRFRKDRYAVSADIEQMFYSFLVSPEHRDYIRFLWYRDNDPDKELIQYRMRAHEFRNSPSPAVATYKLRKCVEGADEAVQKFVHGNFYVDDGLVSLPSSAEAIELLKKTQDVMMKEGNIHLHKIVSNSSDVMAAFQKEDLGKGLKSLDLGKDALPIYLSLGLSWDLSIDAFVFKVNFPRKPDTRRGYLSMPHSVYDPKGFVAPLLLQGKIVLRDITESGAGWDSSLDPSYIQRWQSWTDSVHALDGVCIPRMYFAYSLTDAKDVELHVFSDASEQAIAAVAYLRCQRDTELDVSLVFAKVKLALTHGHTIPRLELCAALLATEVAKTVEESFRIRFRNIRFYSDSKVVLGYINNKAWCFYNYVSNRVDRILRRSSSDQWSYVTSKENPADHGTRGLQTVKQLEDDWLTGPAFLRSCLTQDDEDHPLVNPDDDKAIRVEVNKLVVSEGLAVFRDIMEWTSSWESLISFVATMKKAVRRHNSCKDVDRRTLRQDAEHFLLKLAQRMSFADELRALKSGESIGKDSPVASLSPYLEADDLLRVGGRLRNSVLPRDICNPVILLANSHITRLITINHTRKLHTREGISRKER